MTFYQELQLNQAGSKNFIAGLSKPKDKFVHILTFILKVVLNIAFSISVITLLSMIFGSENSIAGLVLLLGITTFRFTDLDIHATHSIGAVFLIFAIFAVGPKAANLAPTGCDFLINFVCLLLIVVLGCHNTSFFNHAVLVLSYILLYGSDVSGMSYLYRVLCLLLGAVLTSAVLFRNQRKKKFLYGFKDLFKDFKLSDARTRWQIRIALVVSGAVLLSTLLGFTKPVWAGVAAMSVTVPFGDVKTRVESRIRGNVIGSMLFVILYFVLPSNLMNYISTLGGLGLGFSAKYEGQTTWNAFSAMSVAALSFGTAIAVANRVLNNVLGALFALLFGMIIDQLLLGINELIQKRKKQP